MRSVVCGSLAVLLVALGGGCGKSKPSPEVAGRQPPSVNPQPPTDVVARVHWIGMKRLAAETNAASFLRVWNLPQTAKLESQTLDKLALALVGAAALESNYEAIASGGLLSAAANQVPALADQPPSSKSQSPSGAFQSTIARHLSTNCFRPLLDDLVNQESYLEVRQATNQPATLALAIRLDAQRAALWQTNLAAALQSLTRTHPTPTTNGWVTQIQNRESKVQSPASIIQTPGPGITYSVQLRRQGEWVVLALATPAGSNQLSSLNPQLSSSLRLDPTSRRLQSAPDNPPTGFWLEASLDLRRVASALALGRSLPEDVPTLFLEVTGNGKDVLTRGRLDFSKPLPVKLEPWNIPTNLVSDPLAGFTAMRGIQPWLSSLKAWNDLHIGAPPNQLFCWARGGNMPFMTYCAAPLPEASNWVHAVSERLLRECNPWITNHTFGRLESPTNYNGLAWMEVPFMAPFLRSTTDGQTGFAFGGLFVPPFTNRPPPGLLFQQVVAHANLVYYDWELSALRVDDWLHIGQLLRLLFSKAELPPGSASMAWLNAAKTNLSNCVTGVRETGPAQLAFTRVSTAGLTALEMHLLADWLESPQFPHGLNTFLGPQRPLPRPGRVPPSLMRAPRPTSAPATSR